MSSLESVGGGAVKFAQRFRSEVRSRGDSLMWVRSSRTLGCMQVKQRPDGRGSGPQGGSAGCQPATSSCHNRRISRCCGSRRALGSRASRWLRKRVIRYVSTNAQESKFSGREGPR
ncbi:hypothetical protein M406DRAFT_101332 [Cryphonectria parasitica EP155]|uniref:Uncharacterized protein n=1 Tax=Cryphonectria parasitica (strain ATCC 38755 / EP155) TaxID=660469 RepID=A0A9P5CPI7_CRYP1|nr:uncharacterized protein M406DRAFT_101332 [Cryphonectria parasitica EP155]KAF3765467.1 hypothetical protein M406DRAFT_101332 [Cryphonectria parasitica EP155]